MWIGITKAFVAILFVGCAAWIAASEITLAAIGVPQSVKYPEWTKEESHGNLAATVSKILVAQIDKADHAAYGIETATWLQGLGIDLSKPNERGKATFERMALEAKTRFVAYFDIRRITQKNRSEGAILSNLGKPQSETKVEVQVYLFDVEQKLLLCLGSNNGLEGVYEGPYFGTTKKDEISGDPQAKAAIIRNENRKRMEAVGHAVWIAVRERLLIQIKPG